MGQARCSEGAVLGEFGIHFAAATAIAFIVFLVGAVCAGEPDQAQSPTEYDSGRSLVQPPAASDAAFEPRQI
jgi:hypothetical protein